MRAGAEGDAFLGIAGDVETVGIAKAGLVAIGRAEHEEHPILRFEIDAAERPMFCDAARRHPDRRDPARIFLKHVERVSSAQTVPEMASRGSFWPPEITSLTLARTLSIGWPAASSTLRIEVFGCFVSTGIMSSIAASMPAVAAWQCASTSLLPA